MWLCMNWLRKAIVHEFLPYRREAMMAEQMFGDERSVTRSTHGNREFADLSLLLCNIHNHPTGTLITVCISGVHHCCYSYSWTGMCCWAACPICFSIGRQMCLEGEHVLYCRSAIGLGRLTYGRHEREGHGSVLHD
jgi:hypothetical protein